MKTASKEKIKIMIEQFEKAVDHSACELSSGYDSRVLAKAEKEVDRLREELFKELDRL